MKKLLLSTLTSLLILVSCQVNNDDLQDSLEIAELELSISEEQVSSKEEFPYENANRTSIPIPVNAESLQRNLSWIAFFTALIIGPGGDEVSIDISNRMGGSNSILLEDLIGSDIPSESPFKQAFIDVLQSYSGLIGVEDDGGCNGCSPTPGQELPQPPIGNLGDTPGFTTSSSYSSVLNIFDDILDFECIEIYFPDRKPLRFASIEPFLSIPKYSIGHDMGLGNSTPIYIHPIFGGGFPNSTILPITVVVRPRRSNSNGCLFEEYAHIDFTEFY